MITFFGLQMTLTRHLSEDALTRLAFQELPAKRASQANRHLHHCSACHSRFNDLAHTAQTIVEHSEYVVNHLESLSRSRRDAFIERLDVLLDSVPSSPTPQQVEMQYETLTGGYFAPLLKSILTVVCAGLVLLSVWHLHLRSVSAAEFLNRAVASDRSPQTTGGPGVIQRRFRIKTAKRTIEHDAYTDVTGRQLENANAQAEDGDLAIRLALAGVSWDDPLSAASFKEWHDLQPDPSDDVSNSGGGLLTIRTRVSSTSIAQESLTVREDTFHPVERTVEFRESDTVDISEVGLDFLSNEAANNLFSTVAPAISTAAPRAPARALIPSQGQLNETELEARLILNQNNADTGEQIEITQNARGVRIDGLVESENRKKKLSESLQGLPFLSVLIRSLDDLDSSSGRAPQVDATQEQSAVAPVSRLEQYFLKQGRSRDDLGRISAGLFDSSLAVNRSSRSIEQLSLRFSSSEHLSPAAIQARDELLSRTVERLLNDLKEQQQFLEAADLDPDSTVFPPNNSGDESSDLAHLAEIDMTVTKDLISGSAESSRSESAMAGDLAQTIMKLRAAALSIIPGHSNK